jgi:alpha-1,3/alpha-1,6-mannosyltransferase
MYSELPVIAVNDGGPTETVVDGLTGFLCKPDPESFAEVTIRSTLFFIYSKYTFF